MSKMAIIAVNDPHETPTTIPRQMKNQMMMIEQIECTGSQFEGLVFWTDSCTISLFPGWGGWQGCPA